MTKDKMIKLIEALASVGYEIVQSDYLYEHEFFYGNIKLFLFPLSGIKNPLSKERIIQLVETLASAGYAIVKFELRCKRVFGDVELILQSMSDELNNENIRMIDF